MKEDDTHKTQPLYFGFITVPPPPRNNDAQKKVQNLLNASIVDIYQTLNGGRYELGNSPNYLFLADKAKHNKLLIDHAEEWMRRCVRSASPQPPSQLQQIARVEKMIQQTKKDLLQAKINGDKKTIEQLEKNLEEMKLEREELYMPRAVVTERAANAKKELREKAATMGLEQATNYKMAALIPYYIMSAKTDSPTTRDTHNDRTRLLITCLITPKAFYIMESNEPIERKILDACKKMETYMEENASGPVPDNYSVEGIFDRERCFFNPTFRIKEMDKNGITLAIGGRVMKGRGVEQDIYVTSEEYSDLRINLHDLGYVDQNGNGLRHGEGMTILPLSPDVAASKIQVAYHGKRGRDKAKAERERQVAEKATASTAASDTQKLLDELALLGGTSVGGGAAAASAANPQELLKELAALEKTSGGEGAAPTTTTSTQERVSETKGM